MIALRFSSSLPLPFLEQHGSHDEDLEIGEEDALQGGGEQLDTSDLEMGDMDEGPGGMTADFLEDSGEDEHMQAKSQEGGGMTADFLEDSEENEGVPAKVKKGTMAKPSEPAAKRRKLEGDASVDALPDDFLKLLKEEVPSGKKDVSPGDFARVWKLSGRKLGNDMVLAQNQYFGMTAKPEKLPKAKRKGKDSDGIGRKR